MPPVAEVHADRLPSCFLPDEMLPTLGVLHHQTVGIQHELDRLYLVLCTGNNTSKSGTYTQPVLVLQQWSE